MERDSGLVDLAISSRLMGLTLLGTLKARPSNGSMSFHVQRGVDVFPAVGDTVVLPTIEQLTAIVEGESDRKGRILIGHCPTAAKAPVYVDPDRLFGRHLAVLGNTGAGKSCSVAGLVRWSLEAALNARIAHAESASDDVTRTSTPNARFIVLDPNGEYAQAFSGLNARLFRVGEEADGMPLHIPAWLWNGPEWAAFTGAAPGVQRPILFEALRRLRSGLETPNKFETSVRSRIRRYRNRIKVLIQSGDHQKTGVREGVAAVLLNIDKDFQDLSLQFDHPCEALRPALERVAEEARVIEVSARSNRRQDDGFWHNDFSEADLEHLAEFLRVAGSIVGLDDLEPSVDEGSPVEFPVNELPDYVEALAADQSGRDIAQFVDTLSLRIRGLLAHGRLTSILQPSDSETISLADWLGTHIGEDQAQNGPIAVVDLSLVPSEVIHIAVSVLARMVFEATQRYRREHGEELPTTLVLEEAHTFIHADMREESTSPAGRECARVIERIAREGRKFGLGLVLASQRPSEVSPTVLSQCNTFLLHRLVNDRDQDLVRRLVPDGLGPLLRELPSLPTRRAILLGWAVPAPVLVEVQEIPEEYRPHSPDPAFWAVWTGEKERRIDWTTIARRWQGAARVGAQTEVSEDQVATRD